MCESARERCAVDVVDAHALLHFTNGPAGKASKHARMHARTHDSATGIASELDSNRWDGGVFDSMHKHDSWLQARNEGLVRRYSSCCLRRASGT